jgi:tetratricopeptide (TPR) repeat protein
MERLAEDPEDSDAHLLLALCRIDMGRRDEALESAREGVRLAPDAGWSHYVMARVRFARSEHDEALKSIGQGVKRHPENAEYRRLRADIHLALGNADAALAAADEARGLAPEDAGIASTRGAALLELGRLDDAEQSFRASLALDAENAVAHAGIGRVEIRRMRPREAIAGYREALRISPNFEWARTGLVEALKARYPVYGLLLRYFSWIRGFSEGKRWLILVGIWVLVRTATKLAKYTSGPVKTALGALTAAYIVFAILTWVSDPLFNLLLRLNREGRLLLDRDEILASNAVGACLLGATAAGVAYGVTGLDGWLIAALILAVTMPSATGVFEVKEGAPRVVVGGVLAFVVLAGLSGSAILLAYPGNGFGGLLAIGTIGVLVLATWVGAATGFIGKR